MIISMLFAIMYAISNTAFLYQVKGFSETADKTNNSNNILIHVIIAVLFAAFSVICLYMQNRTNDIASIVFQKRLRDKLYESIQTSTYENVKSRGFANISTTIIQDVGSCANTIYGSLSGSLTALLSWVTIYAILIYENIAVASLMIIIAIIMTTFLLFFRLFIKRQFALFAIIRERFNKKTNELIRCKSILKTTGTYQAERHKYNDAALLLQNKLLKCNITTPIIFSSIEISILLSYLVIFLMPRNTDSAFSLSSSQIIMFLTYVPQLWGRYSSLSAIYSNLVSANQYSERIRMSIECSDHCDDGSLDIDIHSTPTLRASNLSYCFSDKNAFSNLNFSLEGPGLVYVTGASGRGKSTLFNIISRLYKNYGGSIKLNGIELRDIKSSCIHKCIGIVHQDDYVFKATFLNNIKLYDDISDKEILNTIKEYNFADVVGDLNSNTFNAGQKKAISIIRVLVRNPAIILLDEIAAGLDSYSEQIVMNAINIISKKKMCFIIEHKSSENKHEKEISLDMK